PLIDRAARAEFATWIERGVELHAYDPCMIHAKYAVIDDDWCTVGTFNFNPTSTGASNEVNLMVKDQAFVARVAAQYQSDLGKSHRITLDEANHRSFLRQALDQVANDTVNVIDLVI